MILTFAGRADGLTIGRLAAIPLREILGLTSPGRRRRREGMKPAARAV